MKTFISYSRRQLYFAESLALSLQREEIDIWFDLQQLQAGTVWSDGLKDGVKDADRLVLVVSRASLESPYTREEWQGVAARGRDLVLVIFEPVDLPDELQDLPTYDFRTGFKSKLKQLVDFLKDGKNPRYDQVAAPSRFSAITKLPMALWGALLAIYGPLIACLLPLIDNLLMPQHVLPDEMGRNGLTYFYLIVAGSSLLMGMRYAIPLLRHTLEYKKIKRGILLSTLIQIPAFLAIRLMGFDDHTLVPLAGIFVTTLLIYLVVLRRSANLLRWMQPEEDLQNFRLRIHQPMVSKGTFDLDVPIDQAGKPVTYSIHVDPADIPFAKRVEQVFADAGHTRVEDDENPQHHIAVLSNRSSQAWTQEITQSHAGKLICIIISTIEFKDSLKETGRYQWVDARDGDRRDIIGLARSLGSVDEWKREAALETTPAMIDRWKVPSAITLQKRMLEIFAVFIVVFGLTELLSFVMPLFDSAEPENADSVIRSITRSASLVVLGVFCMWLTGRAFVYRKIPMLALYGFIVVAVVMTSLFASLPLSPWFPQIIVLPVILYGAMVSRFWLPASVKLNDDEIGIKKSIDRAFTKRTIIVMSSWVIFFIGLAAAIQLKWGPI